MWYKDKKTFNYNDNIYSVDKQQYNYLIDKDERVADLLSKTKKSDKS